MSDRHSDRKQNTRRGAEYLATAVAIAGGTHAYGEVVRHDNPDGPGQFSWPYDVLDITLPADQQPGAWGGQTSAYQAYFGDFYPAFSYSTTYQGNGDLEIFSRGFANRYAAPLDAGTVIGPGLTDGAFITGTVFEFDFFSCDVVYVGYPCYCYYYENCESGTRGILPEGVETYLGARFDTGSGTQYGWIKVVRNWVEVTALAWGFETEPGVSIVAGADPCSADIAGPGGGPDGMVGILDFLELLANWGTGGPGAGIAPPFNNVDILDFLTMLAQWGPCPEQAGAGTLDALAYGAGTVPEE
ncbi:MAG: hypothetical protein ACYSU7_17170 [Planctomycetota bacterium]